MSATATIEKAVEVLLSKAPKRSEAEIREWEYKNIVYPNLFATQLPEPFFARVTNWGEKQRQAYEKCKSLLTGQGAIVALIGPRGLGKTTIAAQLILDRAWDESLAPWERRPPYRKASWMVQQFKALYSDFGTRDNEGLMDAMDSYTKLHPLFIIDEWHEADEMRVHDRMMTDFLDRRYSRNNDTLIISNQSPEEFGRSTNDSTLSRMQESGGIIYCDWASYR